MNICGMVSEMSSLKDYAKFSNDLDQKMKRNTRHAQYTDKILRYLAQNGGVSTWDLALKCFKNHNPRQGDMMSRRIFEGRTDRGKQSPGLRELGVVKISNPKKNGVYQLTTFGFLYSIKKCHFSKNELYQVAENNKNVFPMIFKKIKYFRENKISLKPLEKIANSELGELNEKTISNIPYYEIMSYLRVYKNKQLKIIDFISLWFYTYSLFSLTGNESKTISIAWRLIIIENKDIQKWYSLFLDEVIEFYNHRHNILSKSLIILNKDIQDPIKNREFIDFISAKN